MRDLKELGQYVLTRVRLETTLDPTQVTMETSYFEALDSLGIQLCMMDIEETFGPPGCEVPDHVLQEFARRKPTVQEFVNMVTDYFLGNLKDDEIDENYEYRKMHEW